jgi:hypothetical protein
VPHPRFKQPTPEYKSEALPLPHPDWYLELGYGKIKRASERRDMGNIKKLKMVLLPTSFLLVITHQILYSTSQKLNLFSSKSKF